MKSLKLQVIPRIKMNETSKTFWSGYYGVLRVFLVISFCASLLLMLFYHPSDSTINKAKVKRDKLGTSFIVVTENRKRIPSLIQYYKDSASMRNMIQKERTLFIHDSAWVYAGSSVSVDQYLMDSLISKIRFVNGWSINNSERSGYVLTEFLEIRN